MITSQDITAMQKKKINFIRKQCTTYISNIFSNIKYLSFIVVTGRKVFVSNIVIFSILENFYVVALKSKVATL